MIYTLTLNPAIDRTIYVDEINHVDVTRVKTTRRDEAGKGVNVSKVIQSLEKSSICLGFLAGENGNYIKSQLNSKGITNYFIEVRGETRENIKLIETSTNKVLELNEQGPIVTEDDINKLFEFMDTLLQKDDCLVISGSVPKGVDVSIYKEIIARYKRKGVVTILDASNELFAKALESSPDIIKPNIYELEKYLGKELPEMKDVILECKKLEIDGVKQVIVSMGKDGALYVDCEHSVKFDVPLLKALSTVGAGDSFVAGIAVGLTKFDDPIEMIKYAASVGSASCLTEGTNPGSLEDVNEIYKKITLRNV